MIWMRRISPLLLDNQLNRAVIGTQHRFMDDHVFHARYQFLRNEEIIQSPTNATLPCGESIRPPGILDAFRIQVAKGIHKAMIEELLHPGTLLGHKTRRSHILFWVFQVDRHMCRIEITGNDQAFTVCVETVTQAEKMSIKVQLIVHTLPAALSAREIHIEQAEPRMKRGNDPSLHIEERCVHT